MANKIIRILYGLAAAAAADAAAAVSTTSRARDHDRDPTHGEPARVRCDGGDDDALSFSLREEED